MLFSRRKRELQDSLAAADGPHLWPMERKRFLKTRVPASTKELVRAAAAREYLTEATWFRRVVEQAIRREAVVAGDERSRRVENEGRGPSREGGTRVRIYVRLHHDDRLILQARAAARGMPSATYAAALLRAHLHSLAPLPTLEVAALKRTVAELGAVGRNLNQIAVAANRSDSVSGPSREDLRALVRLCEGLRDHVKGLLKANQRSWMIGHDDSER